jgi:DNA-binding transcriptional ArsR family regulator
MTTSPEPEAEKTIHDLEALRIYFDPLRTRIIHALGDVPRTIQSVADTLGVPFTRLYYHFQLLEKHGFIRQVDSHSFGGAVEEKVYQVAARLFLVDRALMTIGADNEESGLGVVLESVLDRTASDIRRSARSGAIDLQQRAPDPSALFIVRGFSYLSPQRASEFYQRFRLLVDEYVTAAEDDVSEGGENGRYYGLALALYPSDMSEPEAEDTD